VRELTSLAPTLLSVGALFLLVAVFGAHSAAARALSAALCVFLSLRYVWWHATAGMPTGQSAPQQAWAWIFFFFESMAILSSLTVYFFMSRITSRSAEADAHRNSAPARRAGRHLHRNLQ
jgi:hypothetical protein